MGGVRGVAIGRPAIGGVGRVGIGGPGRWAGVGRAGIVGPGRWAGGPGWVGRRVAWGGWRPEWRRGFPIAAGLALAGVGAWGYSNYYSSCVVWDGWQWVNVYYQPYYGYYGYGW
jgi:hypothetical protein